MKMFGFIIPCKSEYKYAQDLKYLIKKSDDCSCSSEVITIKNNDVPLLKLFCSVDVEEYDYIIFMHDDLQIIDKDFFKKALEAFESFDYWGLAGTNMMLTSNPRWHIPVGTLKENYGLMEHESPEGHRFMSCYGRYPAPAVVFDGVFMAFNRKAFESLENVPEINGFHMYDMEMCTQAFVNGFKGGVVGIHAFHDSRGEGINSEEWATAAYAYSKRWNDKGIRILKV